MTVSYWVSIWRHLFSMPLGFLALAVFAFTAVAVIAYRIARDIDGPLTMAGVFTVSFLLASVTLERGEPQVVAFFVAVFTGVGKATYERLVRYH